MNRRAPHGRTPSPRAPKPRAPEIRIPDPCATHSGFRRAYCRRVLDDLLGG
ncbi:hypothetical protein [Thermostaphylospora chromogena]|uniref:hypothetical protein n=1 Tax=Thermostaphylospora chromogena TaxID=35622 RepID=UPI0013F691D0|nr:hypothetical protein [Thermostaphylospora chromogena]